MPTDIDEQREAYAAIWLMCFLGIAVMMVPGFLVSVPWTLILGGAALVALYVLLSTR